MALLNLVRWPNILTIILTEIIIKYALMDYFLTETGILYRLDNYKFVVIVISSVLIASAGNIINDINDVESDTINNHKSRPLVNGKISLQQANILFYIFTFLGVAFSIYAGLLAGNIGLFTFQLLVFIILVFYSIQFKKKKIFGNIAIAIVIALVPILIWFYTINDISNQGIMFNFSLRWMHFTVMFYAIFAFLSNLIREMIKDREDMKADSAVNCNTWAGGVSIEKFRKTIYTLTILLSILIFVFQVLSPQNSLFRLSFLIIHFGLFVFIIPKLMKSDNKEDFHSLSIRMKIIMVMGVLTPILLWL